MYSKLALLSLLPLTSAHFLLSYPPTIGFSDEEEGKYPCGSFDAMNRKTITNFPVGGSSISLKSTHPGAVWFFRAALLNNTEGWVDILPSINQEGQGDFCPPGAKVPAAWVGQDGVIQIVQSAVDGYLYQVFLTLLTTF